MNDDVAAKWLLANLSCDNCRHAKRSIVWSTYATRSYGKASACRNPPHKIFGKEYVDLPEEKICNRWKKDD